VTLTWRSNNEESAQDLCSPATGIASIFAAERVHTSSFNFWFGVLTYRVTTLPEKSWNLVRPFSRPGKSWKTAKVMESHGK